MNVLPGVVVGEPHEVSVGGYGSRPAGRNYLTTLDYLPFFSFVELATGAHVVGYYYDDIVLADGRYRFAVRRIEMHQVTHRA